MDNLLRIGKLLSFREGSVKHLSPRLEKIVTHNGERETVWVSRGDLRVGLLDILARNTSVRVADITCVGFLSID